MVRFNAIRLNGSYCRSGNCSNYGSSLSSEENEAEIVKLRCSIYGSALRAEKAARVQIASDIAFH